MSVDERRSRLLRRVRALSSTEREALAEALRRTGGVRRPEFTAFVEPGRPDVDAADLRAHLAQRLPDYMIPTRYVGVDRLPRTHAGKLDRRSAATLAGTELGGAATRDMVSPRTETERALAGIWRDVLGAEEVGVHDDFFEIGGDSLLSIRVISRAQRAGIHISPAEFFDAPTIAELASAGARAPGPAEQGDVTGPAPLTPIQSWFFERVERGRDHWNQAVLLVPPAHADAAGIERALGILVRHHDALRTRFVEDGGAWRQEFVPADSGAAFRVVDLLGSDPAGRTRRIVDESNAEHRSLSVQDGRLFRGVLFDGGSEFRRLLLVAHHLIVDAVSWGILLEDLSTLTAVVGAGGVTLPSKTASVRAWAEGLDAAAVGADVERLLEAWMRPTSASDGVAELVPIDESPHTRRGTGPEDTLIELPEDLTTDLRDGGATPDDPSLQETILGAVCLAWSWRSGTSRIDLDVEGHGRDALSDQLDVSRTVGWFTTVFPLSLDVPGDSVSEVAHIVHRELGDLPLRGAGHGLLRYLHPDRDVRQGVSRRAPSELLFNFLGVRGGSLPPDSPFEVATEPTGDARPPDSPPIYPLEINASIDAGRLVLRVTFDRARHTSESVAEFARYVREALEEAARRTTEPSTFRGIDDDELRRVEDLLAEIDER